MVSAVTNVRLFDGEEVHQDQIVLFSDGIITAVGATHSLSLPSGCTIIDGTDCTLLPGLIDAHTHTSEASLKLALQFGITTELEMAGSWRSSRGDLRRDWTKNIQSEFQKNYGQPPELLKWLPPMPPPPESDHGHSHGPGVDVSSPEEADKHVARCIENGADYIKVMIEDGHVLAHPNLPLMSEMTLKASVSAAHAHSKIVLAHALTYQSTEQALNVGVDGLAHLFMDGAADTEMVSLFKAKNAFVTPCACLNSSLMGITSPLASDERVTSRLPSIWQQSLSAVSNTYPQGNFKDVLTSIKSLHDAGIDVLVGTDASMPVEALGGLTHGSSVHHELQIFVEAGLTPLEALRAAASVTARRFSLHDRGKVGQGLRADLLLLEGDPTVNIQDTLNIKAIWRRGSRLADRQG